MRNRSLYTLGKELDDGAMYILSVIDLEPAGVLVQAYNQENSEELTLPVSESQLLQAQLTRKTECMHALLESVRLVQSGSKKWLTSDMSGILRTIPLLDDKPVSEYTMGCKAGAEPLTDFLVTGLVELCKVKPVGLDAVQWLGTWLLENNPNKPHVEEPEDG